MQTTLFVNGVTAGMVRLFGGVANGLAVLGQEALFFEPEANLRLFFRGTGLRHTPSEADCLGKWRHWPEMDTNSFDAGVLSSHAHYCYGRTDTEAIHRARRLAGHIAGYVLELIRQERVTQVVTWNPAMLKPYAAAEAARQARVPTVHCENGVFPGTMMVWPQAMHDAQMPRRMWNDVLSGHPPGSGVLSDLEIPHMVPVDVAIPPAWLGVFRDIRRTLVPGSLASEMGPALFSGRRMRAQKRRILQHASSESEVRKPYVLAVLQGPYYMGIAQASHSIKTLHGFVSAIARALQGYNGQYQLVIKEHLDALGSYDRQEAMEAAPDALWLPVGDLDALIQKAEAVVVFNSAVGFNAMTMGAPVIVVGKAFYDQPDVVLPGGTQEQLEESLRKALQDGWRPDPDRVERFVEFTREHCMINADWRQPTADGCANLLRRLIAIQRGWPAK